MDLAELEEERKPALVIDEDLIIAEGVDVALAESTVALAALFKELDTKFFALEFFTLRPGANLRFWLGLATCWWCFGVT